MPDYAALVNVGEQNFQNAQELAVLWQEIEGEIEEHESELMESYAVLGEYDFLVTFEAADRDAAYQTALALQRHGLDAQTMAIEPTENFAELVDDI